ADAALRGRAGEGLALSLLRLPAADRLLVRRRRLLSQSDGRNRQGRGETLSARCREWICRHLQLLPGLWLEPVVGTRASAGFDRCCGRLLCRPRLPDAG